MVRVTMDASKLSGYPCFHAGTIGNLCRAAATAQISTGFIGMTPVITVALQEGGGAYPSKLGIWSAARGCSRSQSLEGFQLVMERFQADAEQLSSPSLILIRTGKGLENEFAFTFLYRSTLGEVNSCEF
jgi:hypothetical protein